MKTQQRWLTPTKVAVVALFFATAACLWLVFWPDFYRGVSAQATSANGASQVNEPVTREFSRSLIGVNGLRILPLLLFPVLLALAGLLLTLWSDVRQTWSRLLLWTNAVLLTSACVLELASVGVFYIPSAVALLASATLAQWLPTLSRRPRAS
ncbi:MAG: hypothetical protein EXR67_05440 [Dehalococcoidia bacterium]|nr:hypothetical protein [Dehalococcoidia bacterium]